mgnify:CR=1 FL=1
MDPRSQRNQNRVVMVLIGLIAAVAIALLLGAQVASAVQCQTPLTNGSPFRSLTFLLRQDSVAAFGVNEAGCAPSPTAVWVSTATLAVVLGLLGAALWLWRMNYKQSDKYLIKDLRKRDGMAQEKEVRDSAGQKALLSKAVTIRPSLRHVKDIAPCMVGLKLGSTWGYGVCTTAEDSIVLIGPPRSGKGFYIVINAIIDAPGAVVTTSTRADNYAGTSLIRASQNRPVVLFDPQGISGLGSTLKWSPAQGCENAAGALRRAEVLIQASGSGQSANNQEWTQMSQQILAWLLHAAALDGRAGRDLGKWGMNPTAAKVAVDILKTDPRAVQGWGMALENELNGDPRTLGSKWMGVSNALQALMVPEVAAAMSPAHASEMLVPERFIEARGTLYLIGTAAGGGSTAPYVMALLDEMTYAARQMAIRSEGNRLDPPLSLVLDEIANLAPWKQLPQIMADGGGVGISTMVVLQSLAQARGQWGENEAQAIFDAAIVKVQLGGAGNPRDLEDFSKLAGERQVKEVNRSWGDDGSMTHSEQLKERAVITVDEMRRIPPGQGLYFGRRARPFLLTMVRWIDRKDAEQIKAGFAQHAASLSHELQSQLEGIDSTEKPSV